MWDDLVWFYSVEVINEYKYTYMLVETVHVYNKTTILVLPIIIFIWSIFQTLYQYRIMYQSCGFKGILKHGQLDI